MEPNTTWPQFEIDFITSVESKVALLHTAAYIISIPLGLILIYGIMLYEKVGVDAQKRSLFKQILLYKNLCVIRPHYVMALNDNFWASQIQLWNSLFACILNSLDFYFRNGHDPPVYLFISGEGDIYSTSRAK